jgi:hypothetical protein
MNRVYTAILISIALLCELNCGGTRGANLTVGTSIVYHRIANDGGIDEVDSIVAITSIAGKDNVCVLTRRTRSPLDTLYCQSNMDGVSVFEHATEEWFNYKVNGPKTVQGSFKIGSSRRIPYNIQRMEADTILSYLGSKHRVIRFTMTAHDTVNGFLTYFVFYFDPLMKIMAANETHFAGKVVLLILKEIRRPIQEEE